MFQKRRRYAVGLLIVAALVVLASSGGYLYLLTQQMSLDGRIAKIRAAGEPATAAELAAYYAEPPPDKNVTAILGEAMALLQGNEKSFAQDGEYGSLPFLGVASASEPLLPGSLWPDLPKAEKCLAERAAALKLIHQAMAAGGAARFPVDFSRGTQALLSDTQALRGISRLLSLESLVHAHRGNADAALKSLIGLVRLQKAVENEPILISQLVRCALVNVAVEQVRTLTPRLKLNDAQLAELQRELALVNMHPALARAMIGERAILLITLTDQQLRRQTLGATSLPFFVEFGHAAKLVYVVDRLDETVQATRKPWLEALVEVAKMAQPVRASSPFSDSVYFNLLAPALETGLFAMAQAQTRAQLAAAALGVERHRRRAERSAFLPATLDKLDPNLLSGVNADIFSGKPFLLKPAATSFQVYSVGFNRVDDGAIDGDTNDWRKKPDIVLKIDIASTPAVEQKPAK